MHFANLHTTLLLEVFSRDAGDCEPSRLVFALIKSLGLEGVLGLGLGGGITEPETFLCPRFILFTLSSSSFPMVFDLTRGNLDRIDNRWKPSLIRWDGLGEGWGTEVSEQSWGMMEDTVTLSGSESRVILRKMQQWRHTNFRQSRHV